jgi:SAM-dependent methyltransferase
MIGSIGVWMRAARPGLASERAGGTMRVYEMLERLGRSRRRQRSVDFGSLRRTTPLDRDWGWSRGTPIDRYYISQFLERARADIRGHVAEFGARTYSDQYADGQVSRVDVLSLEGGPATTLIADLNVAEASAIPIDTFDCIVCTQTLQLVYELRHAIGNLHRALRPGGVLLATVPGISARQLEAGNWSNEWCWSITANAARALCIERFSAEQVTIECYGNVFAASAFLYGVAAEELEAGELDTRDPAYPVVVTARAVKT